MSDIAIRVGSISKTYRIGANQQQYRTLRDAISDAAQAPFRLARKVMRRDEVRAETIQTIWALKDVSFDIRQGEVVGVIGRNGAGKSTLLKVLSRITEPTAGHAEIHGRVGSLLEVGTGFHHELTGRENIFLNGAILGMKRAEIARKFDEMVAFAEVDRFVDTPVKHYSSGMYLRLAFAVAAHLETEVVLVDEVLAVGDSLFQRKCLNKMQDVGKQGRTVLFVSHNMPAITRLCDRVILIDEGTVAMDDRSPRVVSAYLSAGVGTMAVREWPDEARAPKGEIARLCAVRIRTADGQISDAIDIRRPVRMEMEFDVAREGYVLSPWFELYNEEGTSVFVAADLDPNWRRRPRPVGRYVSTAWIPGNLLSEGILFVGVGLTTLEPLIKQFAEREVVAFHVIDTMEGDSARGDWAGRWKGAVRPLLKWSTEFEPGDELPVRQSISQR